MKSNQFVSEIQAKLEAAKKLVTAYETILAGEELEKPLAFTQPEPTGSSLVSVIRQVIKLNKGGISSTNIIAHLKKIGFQVQGKSPLGARVHIELQRLKKQGEISRKGDVFVLN